LIKKLERMMKDEWPEHNIEVAVFGSSGNLLSSDDSDVDICVTTSLKKLESMHSLAMLLHKSRSSRDSTWTPSVEGNQGNQSLIISTDGMEKVVCRACDINVNNPLALENTRMIRTYVQLDDRVRPLAKIIKYWTKRRLLNDAGKHSAHGSRAPLTNFISSFRWHNQFLHLDMYDHQLSPETKSAYHSFFTKDARRQAIHCQRQTVSVWR
jgi:DNA polymerase sigma